jgi:hypothetical protein
MVAETSIRPMRSVKTWEGAETVITSSILTDFGAEGKLRLENASQLTSGSWLNNRESQIFARFWVKGRLWLRFADIFGARCALPRPHGIFAGWQIEVGC